MEGILLKWTNYWNGWQPRWFVLTVSGGGGVLSYYHSRADVGTGCRGSLKVSACDICVHASDPLRLDLAVSGEQHYYLRAADSKLRQQWLLALARAKQSHIPTSSSSTACSATVGTGARTSRQSSGEVVCSVERVRAKRRQLRLYCDLLMQQTHQLKTAASAAQLHSAESSQTALSDAGTLLAVTCDTFIHTLDECMLLLCEATSDGDQAKLSSVATVAPSVGAQINHSVSLSSGSSEGARPPSASDVT